MVENSHRDLGVIMPNTLNWSTHHDFLSYGVHKMLVACAAHSPLPIQSEPQKTPVYALGQVSAHPPFTSLATTSDKRHEIVRTNSDESY